MDSVFVSQLVRKAADFGFEYIQVLDDDANVIEIIKFCGIPSTGLESELVFHNEGDPYLIGTAPIATPLMDIAGSFIIKFRTGDLSVISADIFEKYFKKVDVMEKELDYSPVMGAIKEADQEFTGKHGCGAPYQDWDAALEQSVREYNVNNNTHFDPTEARHQYIEQQESYLDSSKGKQGMAELVAATKQ